MIGDISLIQVSIFFKLLSANVTNGSPLMQIMSGDINKQTSSYVRAAIPISHNNIFHANIWSDPHAWITLKLGVSICSQVFIWTNFDPSAWCNDVFLRAISLKIPLPSITKIALKIIEMKFNSNFPVADGLNHPDSGTKDKRSIERQQHRWSNHITEFKIWYVWRLRGLSYLNKPTFFLIYHDKNHWYDENTKNIYHNTVKPVYNDHLMGHFSAFWSSSRWPRAT